MTTPTPEEAPPPSPRAPGDAPLNLIGLTRHELARALAGLGVEAPARPLRAKQLWHWIYRRGVHDFAAMTTLSKPLRARLAGACTLARPEPASEARSRDGTRKWLLAFADGAKAETVYIPEEDRGAVCISTQVGCTLTCAFCRTGTQRLVRNLSAGEIVGQVMLVRDRLRDWSRPEGERLVSNIVVMGMGEPLYNYEAVAKALKIAMDPEGIALSRRRITLSTSGVVPLIARAGAELKVNLAVSLHAVTDALRDRLVPVNRKYPLAELIAACRRYPAANNARRITFEYVMLEGVNDSPADARALGKLVHGIPAKINLIPFNPWPGAPFACSSDRAIARFAAILNQQGLSAPVRVPRGRDILAACGQLRSASERPRRGALRRPEPG